MKPVDPKELQFIPVVGLNRPDTEHRFTYIDEAQKMDEAKFAAARTPLLPVTRTSSLLNYLDAMDALDDATLRRDVDVRCLMAKLRQAARIAMLVSLSSAEERDRSIRADMVSFLTIEVP